ncbi:Tol-Pal system subunit TolQ, partial [Acinetobacter baumannii]|nr:Tol-Pal system subunit TolQ [Acinetobacter baumannii]
MATNIESTLHISDLILQASPVVQLVMLILLLASIFSWYLIAKLHMSYKKARQDDEHFQKMFWSGAELNTLYNNAQLNSKRSGLEDIFYQGLSEFFKLKKRQAPTSQMIEGTERILRVGLSRDQGSLEYGLGTLASIGSVAPYIGLFGTVWGIMNAFIGLAAVDQVTLATVAPG